MRRRKYTNPDGTPKSDSSVTVSGIHGIVVRGTDEEKVPDRDEEPSLYSLVKEIHANTTPGPEQLQVSALRRELIDAFRQRDKLLTLLDDKYKGKIEWITDMREWVFK